MLPIDYQQTVNWAATGQRKLLSFTECQAVWMNEPNRTNTNRTKDLLLSRNEHAAKGVVKMDWYVHFFSLPSSRSAIHSHKLRENQQQQKNMIIVAVAVVIIPYFIFIYSLIRFGAVDLDSVLSTFASQILFDVAINRCKQ